MIAVGIPSYNEADNISQLVTSIDKAAILLGEEILIINSDNSSTDGTSSVFQATPTKNKKIPLLTTQKGKGRNLQKIIQFVADNTVEYCFFVDGDVTSMEPSWLGKHITEARCGSDYVVPNYARKMQEGNATNHYFYPVLNYLSNNQAPYQPIAGDVGMSYKLATHVSQLHWSESSLKYGVDIFITMHALFDGFNVREISLGRKLHKPSFGKMIDIFIDEATCYFEARKDIQNYRHVTFSKEENKPLALLSGTPIPATEIEKRVREAQHMLASSSNIIHTDPSLDIGKMGINSATWAKILTAHEMLVHQEDASVLARSLTPFYLLRVTQYLHDVKTAEQAVEALNTQTIEIAQQFKLANV